MIPNSPPRVSINLTPATPRAGSPVTASLQIVDPDVADRHGWSLSWGDGSREHGDFQAGVRALTRGHTYERSGSFLISAEACDGAAACSTATVTVTIGAEATQTATSPVWNGTGRWVDQVSGALLVWTSGTSGHSYVEYNLGSPTGEGRGVVRSDPAYGLVMRVEGRNVNGAYVGDLQVVDDNQMRGVLNFALGYSAPVTLVRSR